MARGRGVGLSCHTCWVGLGGCVRRVSGLVLVTALVAVACGSDAVVLSEGVAGGEGAGVPGAAVEPGVVEPPASEVDPVTPEDRRQLEAETATGSPGEKEPGIVETAPPIDSTDGDQSDFDPVPGNDLIGDQRFITDEPGTFVDGVCTNVVATVVVPDGWAPVPELSAVPCSAFAPESIADSVAESFNRLETAEVFESALPIRINYGEPGSSIDQYIHAALIDAGVDLSTLDTTIPLIDAAVGIVDVAVFERNGGTAYRIEYEPTALLRPLNGTAVSYVVFYDHMTLYLWGDIYPDVDPGETRTRLEEMFHQIEPRSDT